jgi:hypothetical protein
MWCRYSGIRTGAPGKVNVGSLQYKSRKWWIFDKSGITIFKGKILDWVVGILDEQGREMANA